jgi:hypothetical protein
MKSFIKIIKVFIVQFHNKTIEVFIVHLAIVSSLTISKFHHNPPWPLPF